MSSAATSVGISYFGKLPSQRDFVKSTDSHQLLALLDRWAEQGLEQLSRDVEWKLRYDAAQPFHFAFLGSRSKAAIAGHLAPSRDTSGRRYPFLTAARIDPAHPAQFMARSPLALARLWSALARQSRAALDSNDAQPALRELAGTRIGLEEPARYAAPFRDFLDMHTLGSLQAMLRGRDGEPVVLRRLLPGLGLLLQPLLTRPDAHLERGLWLPLPAETTAQPLVATLWMDLVSRFLARGSFEVVLLLPQTPVPGLVLGFNGTHVATLHGQLDARVGQEQAIALADPEWVDDAVADDYGLAKLASYLAEDDLPLARAHSTFRETFLGA